MSKQYSNQELEYWREFPAGRMGSIPGQGTIIPNAMWCSQKKKNWNIGTKLTGQPKESKLRCVFDYACDFSVFGIFNTKRWRRKDMIS